MDPEEFGTAAGCRHAEQGGGAPAQSGFLSIMPHKVRLDLDAKMASR
jgi:hypothetical protein